MIVHVPPRWAMSRATPQSALRVWFCRWRRRPVPPPVPRGPAKDLQQVDISEVHRGLLWIGARGSDAAM
jgi:hypothetical protein